MLFCSICHRRSTRAGFKLHGKDLQMRSVKLLVAMAVMAAFVAGPVLAQDAMGGAAPSGTSSSKPATTKGGHKKTGKHHHAKKSSSSTSAPASSTPAQ